MIRYRVRIKISYYEAWYEFDDSNDAVVFAQTLLEHHIQTEDCKTSPTVMMEVVNVEAEKAAESEDE